LQIKEEKMEWRNSDSMNYFSNSNLQIYNTLLLCCVSANGERKSGQDKAA